MPTLTESLKLWDRYGEFVLMATGYQDRVLAEARGCTIVDVDGNALVDLEAGQVCSLLGHNHPRLIARIVEQTQAMLHHGTGFLSRPIFEAAEKMAAIAPGNLRKSIFLSTGAEANECAFRIAKIYTGKRGIVGFTRGYSGLTLATIAVSTSSRDASLSVPGALKLLTPHCAQCPVHAQYPGCELACLSASEELVRTHANGDVAAIIVEPILSAGGMIVPPAGYLKRLHEVAKRLGALLIADEAQTGMGRTGTWFGLEAEGVVPDILVISKGVGGGFPASGVIVTDEIAAGILGRFGNFSSHQSDPVAAAAVSAVVDIVREEDLVTKAAERGAHFLAGLQALAEKYGLFGNVRGRGLMIGVDTMALPQRGLSREEAGKTFEHLCREAGVHLKSIFDGAVFRILPPLTISDAEIDTVLRVFEDVTVRIVEGRVGRVDLASRNRFTRQLEATRTQRLTLRRAMRKAWETSPAMVVDRLKGLVGRKG